MGFRLSGKKPDSLGHIVSREYYELGLDQSALDFVDVDVAADASLAQLVSAKRTGTRPSSMRGHHNRFEEITA